MPLSLAVDGAELARQRDADFAAAAARHQAEANRQRAEQERRAREAERVRNLPGETRPARGSVCKCGGRVFWFQRPEGGWHCKGCEAPEKLGVDGRNVLECWT